MKKILIVLAAMMFSGVAYSQVRCTPWTVWACGQKQVKKSHPYYKKSRHGHYRIFNPWAGGSANRAYKNLGKKRGYGRFWRRRHISD